MQTQLNLLEGGTTPASLEERDKFPPGTVAIPCSDLARYHHFTHDLTLLDVPDGTVISMYRSASVVQNMNMMIKGLNPESAWVWIIGDDHVFRRDTVLRLLKHDVDIVVPLCTRRGPPFSLVDFDSEGGKDEFGRPLLHIQDIAELPASGLVEMVAAGSSGMLVKREVFDTMEEPWFENSDNISTNEDVTFCRKARALGYKVWVDVDTRIGHVGNFAVWPDYREAQWGITIDFQGHGRNDIFLAGGIRTDDQGTSDSRTGVLEW